jgi:glycerol uptake facilitator-like aquaporin
VSLSPAPIQHAFISPFILSSVIGAAIAQLAVFWTAQTNPDVTESLWVPAMCNQIVMFLSVLTACLPYLRPLMESLESGVVRVPEDAEELRSFAGARSRTS